MVLLVIDGLGWHQLKRHATHAPRLAGLKHSSVQALRTTTRPAPLPVPLTTVAPSTTSAALPSITTGAAPGEHGLVGHTFSVSEGLLNVLRWTVAGAGDARTMIVPEQIQPVEPFGGGRACVITRSKFAGSGFTQAHLRGADFVGYTSHRQIVPLVRDRVEVGDKFVYAYYDALDSVAHLYGLGQRYLRALAGIDALVGRLIDALPADVALLVTADHGVLNVAEPPICLDGTDWESAAVGEHAAYSSGEPRFRWLHAKPGRAQDLLAAARLLVTRLPSVGATVSATSNTGDTPSAEVLSQHEVISAGWLGAYLTPAARTRLGDVALVARDPVVFGSVQPGTTGRRRLIGHHGALSSEEMLVPLAVFWGRCR